MEEKIHWVDSIADWGWERIRVSKFEDRSTDDPIWRRGRRKDWQKNFSDFRHYQKCNTHVIRVPEGESTEPLKRKQKHKQKNLKK